MYALIAHVGDESVSLTVKMPTSHLIVEKQLGLADWTLDAAESPIESLGIVPLTGKILPVVAAIVPKGASERAGLWIDDRIIAVDGEPVTAWAHFVQQVQQSPEQDLAVTVERDGQPLTLTLTPDAKKVRGQLIGFVGLSPQWVPLPDEYRTLLQYGPLQALWQGVQKTWHLTGLTVDMIGKLVGGIVSLDNLSGPISIAKGAGNSADYGLVYFLGFLALISVNLGLMNLLPLPVLDGGHLVYFLIEAVTGKPVPEKIQDVGFKIGSAILLLLMGIALFNDFARL
jgi:regulator of sigma E protease